MANPTAASPTPTIGRAAPAPAARKAKLDAYGLVPVDDLDITRLIQHPHPHYRKHATFWKWMTDSLEGGERYRDAVYGVDRRGLPARNLFRHRREYPDPKEYPNASNYLGYAVAANGAMGDDPIGMTGPWPGQTGADPATIAQDDEYEYRRARTPVPEFVAEAVEIHLSKLFNQEIGRDTGSNDDDPGLPELEAWWSDVDGRGTAIDDWMRQTIAPLMLVLGCLDVCLDHPAAPPGQAVATRADELRLGLNRCVASYILPVNMVWWRLDAAGRYRECLVREFADPCDRVDYDKSSKPIDPDGDGVNSQEWRHNYVRWRLWRPDMSVLYNFKGEEIERTPHGFGRVPIVRLVDVPKHETPHVGKSRYEAIAEYQREYYNRDSELILSDSVQGHPLLALPEDYLKADNTVSVGPSYILPMKKSADGSHYTAPTFVSPSKDPADSLRKNKDDIVAMKDRRACLARPLAVRAANSSTASTDPQAAAAKELDQIEGHNLLASLAQSLAKAERALAEYALLVARDGKITPEDLARITVTYPSKFDLYAASDLILNLTNLLKTLPAVGNLPMFEREVLRSIVRQTLPGLEDEDYDTLDQEVEQFVERAAKTKEEFREIGDPGFQSPDEALEGDGSAEQAAQDDPLGQSGTTAVTTSYVSV